MDIEKLNGVLGLKVEQAKSRYQRLVVLVGASSFNQTTLLLAAVAGQKSGHLIEVGQALSLNLLEAADQKRPAEVVKLLQQQTRPGQAEVLYLNHIELLFEPSLKVRPLDLFKNISRSQTLVVAFDGKLGRDQLIYAEPGHPEYQFYPAKDFLIVEIPNDI